MKLWNFALAGIVLIISNSANAALVSRLGGLAYYDTEADLTWLADANGGVGSIFDNGISNYDGRMTWQNAVNWAESLSVAGITGWRLPTSDTCFGFNCLNSEMGNLFYNVLGNTADDPLNVNTGPFTNGPNGNKFVQSSYFWSSTDYMTNTNNAWGFGMFQGFQYNDDKSIDDYAWAVHSGDVSAVPIPAAAWLFISGLIGLVGFVKGKN
jgi:Protein of unknown function (DUF1566)